MVTLFDSDHLKRQQVFRVLLEALSQPGRVFQLPITLSSSDQWTSLFLILETLLNQEVSYCFLQSEQQKEIARKVSALTKSPEVLFPEADFIICPFGQTRGEIEQAKRGHPEYPDEGATILYRVQFSKNQGSMRTGYLLQGPGIPNIVPLPAMEGFDYHELELLARINREYPLGIDSFFFDPQGRVMGLPRSTNIIQE